MKNRKKSAWIPAFGIAWLAAVFFLEPTVHAQTGRRFALLIGNGDYQDGTLISGSDNAEALGPVLKQIGFDVKTVTDANLKTMSEELVNFGARIEGASAVLFFYSGHGFQLNGESYLLPVGGSQREDRSLPLRKVLNTLALASRAQVKLMILDACRSKADIEGSQQGWAKPQAGPENLVQAFATLPNMVAVAEGPLSPYTKALVARFREPGLNLKQFFTEVRNDVTEDSSHGQHPQFPTTEGLDGADDEFRLSEPARIEARVELADDDLIVLLNGKLALNHQTQEALPKEELRKHLELKSGENELTVLLSNQKSLRHGLAWERANGWGYKLRLIGPDGQELTSPECGGKDPCFSGGEEIPFKNGPHHGKTFVVATAKLDVDPTSGMSPRVSLREVKTDLWQNAPFWARDQDLLYFISITKLPLGLEIVGNVKDFFEILVKEVLGVRVNVPDPNRIYSVVRGNVALKELVIQCMDDSPWHAARMADFEDGLKKAKNGDPKPFDGFVENLNECIRKLAEDSGFTVARNDIRVCTSFEDWTKEGSQPSNHGSHVSQP
jgi:hypothetical protein